MKVKILRKMRLSNLIWRGFVCVCVCVCVCVLNHVSSFSQFSGLGCFCCCLSVFLLVLFFPQSFHLKGLLSVPVNS